MGERTQDEERNGHELFAGLSVTRPETTALITGATGFLGCEIVRALLARDRTMRVVALIRARDQAELDRRRRSLVAGLSERLCRQAHEVLPVVIHRPSIIVGRAGLAPRRPGRRWRSWMQLLQECSGRDRSGGPARSRRAGEGGS